MTHDNNSLCKSHPCVTVTVNCCKQVKPLALSTICDSHDGLHLVPFLRYYHNYESGCHAIKNNLKSLNSRV